MILAYCTVHKVPGCQATVAMTMPVRPFMRWSPSYTFIVEGVAKMSLSDEFWKDLKN